MIKNNIFFKIIFSIPVILLCLFFIPFVGIILSIIRIKVFNNNKLFAILCVLLSIVIYFPYLLFNKFNISIDINIVNKIITSDFYKVNFISFSKNLFIVFIIYITYLILKEFLGKLFGSIFSKIFEKLANQDKEISIMNDMKMKEKRFKAKNSNYVKCKKCGADNIINEKIDTCNYCRSKLVNDKYTD